MSTWEALRDLVHDAIGSVATSLGFPAGKCNVGKWLPEHRHSAKRGAYYYGALSSGEKEIRVWAVTATQRLDMETRDTNALFVDVTVTAFYQKGADFAGRELLQRHMSVAQQAIRTALEADNTIFDVIRNWGFAEIREVDIAKEKTEGKALRGQFTISFEKANGVI